jgi:thiamine biosynthesis lipoprotein ApbE
MAAKTSPSQSTTSNSPWSALDKLFDKLARMDREEDAMRLLNSLPDSEVERLARAQGLKFATPQEARGKLIETLATQHPIERIAGGG